MGETVRKPQQLLNTVNISVMNTVQYRLIPSSGAKKC